MRVLSQADCLALWESGQRLHPLDQGLLAVHAAFPELSSDSVADWPLGRLNRALAELRCGCFGRWLRGWTACERCGDKLEFEVDGAALAEGEGPSTVSIGSTIQVEGQAFRLPTTRDLARIAGEVDASEATMRLLEVCAVDEGRHGPTHSSKWTDAQMEVIGESMARADPMAEILLHFDCPQCSYSFDKALDLAAFLWSEVEGRAKRLLLDVHLLASAYGWSETEILSMNPMRRSFYLEMVRG
jgi:hypothetical protein